jgi:hypothetical protein
MHICSEMLSVIIFPLLPPLAIVVLVIIHLMIITSLALPFHTRSNPATPSPQSKRQIVSLGRGGVGARN